MNEQQELATMRPSKINEKSLFSFELKNKNIMKAYKNEDCDSIFREINKKANTEDYPLLSNEDLLKQYFLNWAIAKHGNHRVAANAIIELNKIIPSRLKSILQSELLIVKELSAQTYMTCEDYTNAISEFSDLVKMSNDQQKINFYNLEIASCLHLSKKPINALDWCTKILGTQSLDKIIRIQATLLWVELKILLTVNKAEIDKLSQTINQLEFDISSITPPNKIIAFKYAHLKYQLASLKHDNDESALMLRKLFEHCVEWDYSEKAKKVLHTLYMFYPQHLNEHEKILLVDEILKDEHSDVCLTFHNNKAKIQPYSPVHFNHVFTIDLQSGLFIKNSIATAFSDLQLKTIKAIVFAGHLGIKHKKLAEIVYSEEFWEISNGEERIRKIIQKLKSFGINIYCKNNKYFINLENFNLILQKSSQDPHLTNYLKKELPQSFHRKDVESKLGLKKVMSLNYIKEWMDQGKIQSFNRGKNQRYTLL